MQGGRSRPLADKSPLLWDKPKDWPKWLAADSLHPEFRKKIEEWEKQRKENPGLYQPWENLTNNFLLRREKHYLDHLVPIVKEWTSQEWNHRSFDVLELLVRWESQHQFDQVEPWIQGEEGRRNVLSASLRLPTNKGWLPAADCFAGKDWDGPKAFDEFFKDRNGIGIVQSFKEWPDHCRETNKDKWKGLLRWIGVSWEPKVCRTPEFTIRCYLWEKYSQDKRHSRGRPGENYFVQYFPACTDDIGRIEIMRDILPTLYELLAKKKAKRFYRWERSTDQYRKRRKKMACPC